MLSPLLAPRWDELLPPFNLRLEIEDEAARLVHGGEARDGYGYVHRWLDDVGRTGLLRKKIVDRLVSEGIARDADSADRMTTRVLKRLRKEDRVEQRGESRNQRYWLSKHLPEEVRNAD